MAINQLINSFNAGEFSPFAGARTDIEKYKSACQQLQNFIILPYGGAMRRPGTEYLGTAKFADKRCRLIGFNFSTTTNFVLEFGEEYVRFWSNGARVVKSSTSAWLTSTAYAAGAYVTEAATIYYCLVAHTSGVFATDLAAGKWIAQSILEVPSPYDETELRDLQYVQINDIMYIVHPNHAPRKLSRFADDNWTLAEPSWDWPAALDENTEATTITPSGTSGSITLTASAALFEASHVGSYWIIAHRRESSSVELALTGTANSSALDVLGDWELTTYGNWQGTVKVQRSFDGSTWETIRSYPSAVAGERNVSATGKEEKQCKLRVSFTAVSAGSASPNARLQAGDNRVYGFVKVSAFTDSTHVTATVVKALYANTATAVWAEGAFSEKRGYPRTVSLHEQRLVFGGTLHRPLSVWGSIVDDFENFRYTSNDDGAFLFTLSANESNPVQWLISQGSLLIGTAGDEWTLGASDDSQVLSPTNVRAKRQSSYGSKYLQARIVNEVVLFSQRQGRKVRELTYAFEKDGWVAPDLTILAEHIGRGEFVETAFQQQPDAIFWAITGAGRLVGMTYERDQNVVGWHRHTTQGEFESVATIYGGSGADEVWFSVSREVDGETVRYIERLKPDFRQVFEDEDKPNWWYLDCAKAVTLSPGSVVSGLGHLEGFEVSVLADGAVQPDRTVESGAITLEREATNVIVGLAYDSILQPMTLNIDLRDGTAQGRKARVPRIVARFYKSLGGQYSSDGTIWNEFYSRSVNDPMDDSPPAFSGFFKVSTGANYQDGAEVILKQSRPLPMCVLAIIAKWDVFGD